MHIEIYIVRVELKKTGEGKVIVLSFEVGETDEDRIKLTKDLKTELAKELDNEPYKWLGYTSKRIYPKDN